jgi:hypothetical protein
MKLWFYFFSYELSNEQYPERVDSLMLINTLTTAPGWIEWGYQKRNINHLRQHGMTQVKLDSFLNEKFTGKVFSIKLSLEILPSHYLNGQCDDP